MIDLSGGTFVEMLIRLPQFLTSLETDKHLEKTKQGTAFGTGWKLYLDSLRTAYLVIIPLLTVITVAELLGLFQR